MRVQEVWHIALHFEMQASFLGFVVVFFKLEEAVEAVEAVDCGNTRLRLVFPQLFSFSQTSTRVSITR